MASSPIAIALRAVSPKYILTIGPLFGWLLRHPIQQEPSKSEAPSPSLFFFFFALFAAQNHMLTASPTRSTRSNLFFNAPPIADAIIWLVVTSPCQMAAIEGRCSTRLSIFRWAPFRRTKQGENSQRARSRAPGAFIRLIGSRDAAIQVHGGCFHGEGGQSRWR
jgi:hypothetical protein